jgi:2'-5' RNA ligase
VEAALDRRGFGREPRAWHPHVTIGRVFDHRRWRRDAARDLLAAVTATSARSFGAFPVESVALMRSDLSPSGARYQELARVRLVGLG